MRVLYSILFSLISVASYGQTTVPDVWAYGNDSALVITQRMLVTNPNEASVHFLRAQALLNNKNKEAAHKELLYTLDCLSKSSLELYRVEDVGNTLKLKFHDYDGAVRAADYILSKEPSHIRALEIKAYALLSKGTNDEAIKLYENLTKIAPRNSKFDNYIIGTYNGYIGDAYRSRQEFFKAVQHYTDAIQLGNNDALAYGGRAYCKGMLSDYLGALTDYDLALSKAGDKDEFYYDLLNERTYVKGSLNKHTEVIHDATMVIVASKDKYHKAYAYFLRAFAKHEMSNKVGACTDWSKAGELGEERAYLAIQKFCK